MINVFLGGSLHESIYAVNPDIPRLHSPLPRKRIEIAPGSILQALLRSDRERVNALHHQSIDVVGAGLSIVARDQHGIVQAIECRGDPFLVGVQWHPEFMFFNPRQQRLFAAIVESARNRRLPWKDASEFLRPAAPHSHSKKPPARNKTWVRYTEARRCRTRTPSHIARSIGAAWQQIAGARSAMPVPSLGGQLVLYRRLDPVERGTAPR
jgi:hypothetical protein